MAKDITVRRVNVEFLRPGPSHNQLLSPYTQYLAVCNDAGAAVVTVPYEQRVFERRLKELRYETGDQEDRLGVLHEIGRDIGRVLQDVPGFTGSLMHNPGQPNTLIHVRLTLSAAELAQLPFELAEVPVGSSACALCLQTRPPVTLTRHIRTVSCDGVHWPNRPRVLFVSGDPEVVPFESHREALLTVIERFRHPRDARAGAPGAPREQFGDLLTVLVNPTLRDLERECDATAYTHIHLLTHGDLNGSGESFGLVFRHENGSSDVVSGERFVSAITEVRHRPTVVTIASCDSANVGSVVIPDASFAHAIHQAGVAFVVAAQFPLSKNGSVCLTGQLYGGLLWGDDPLVVLRRARAELHAGYDDWHDWASVVAYEALPDDLEGQLEWLRYSQAKRAADAALEKVDDIVAARCPDGRRSVDTLRGDVMYALGRMPADGQFAVECIGVKASALKRLAQASFVFASSAPAGVPADDSIELLDQARLEYLMAVQGMLRNDALAPQRRATLHWVLVQAVVLKTVLTQEFDRGLWEAARLAADNCRDHHVFSERAWAHGSLAELWLLRLLDPELPEPGAEQARALAIAHTRELHEMYPGFDEFPVKATRRQFDRYVSWWGTPLFEAALRERHVPICQRWRGDGGVVATALELVRALERHTGRDHPPRDDDGRQVTGRDGQPDTAIRSHATPSVQPADAQRPPEPAAAPSVRQNRRSDAPFLTIEALPADHGDCLWIEYGTGRATHRVLVDCGTLATSKALLQRVRDVPDAERTLDLFVMSHIDSDHIGGALPLFKAVRQGLRFGDVWFNGWRHVSGELGAKQGEMFSTALLDFQLPWNAFRSGKAVLVDSGPLPEHELPGGMKITLLSPARAQLDVLAPVWKRELKKYHFEPGARMDYSQFLRGTPTTRADVGALKDIEGLAGAPFSGDAGAPNGTSIAFLAEYEGASMLLTADAHAPVLVEALKRLLAQRGIGRLKLDLLKVPHHGSQKNVNVELLELLDCPRYLISTDGEQFYHPDRQAIARIVKHGGPTKTIYFNYATRHTDAWGDPALGEVLAAHGCTIVYPPTDTPGVEISLL
jgi:hypothetical protein